ncbi:hypothetical protein HYDPIDRAFT_45653, partial [Hydnomerulius pinastri MD-312]
SRYSQPKLELYGLYRALRHFRLYIIGVKVLHVEVDAKYIKGMLNEPDLQPNAAINRWIQGILLFDFELIHVPATKFKGPDALSRRELGKGEIIEPEDDSWLDEIALYAATPRSDYRDTQLAQVRHPYDVSHLPSSVTFAALVDQEATLSDIYHYLTTLQSPTFPSVNA